MAHKLDNKEASLFRQVVRHYDSKQYKKGLKCCEQILRRAPNHGETLAMKALILNSRGDGEEAFTLAKLALQKDMKSHVTWHVYGLLYRSVKNYEEAIKAYRMALRIEPDSQTILRDFSLLQIQMRDYTGYCESRKAILTARPQLRQNWTALAVAYHLAGSLESAENVLTRYEDTLKPQPPKTDLEHAEAALYKNTIIAETGQIQQAYDHLEAFCKTSLDGLSALELQARYLLQLERREESAAVYSTLLERNPERRDYFQGLEASMEDRLKQPEERAKIYADLVDKNPRGDAVRRMPLDFLHGETFTRAADSYLRMKLDKGVTSTFANVRALYGDLEKRASILELVRGYVGADSEQAQETQELTTTEDKVSASDEKSKRAKDSSKPDRQLHRSALYFLAQHFNYPMTQDLRLALEYVDQALEEEPERIEFLMTRGRILKHMGDISEASITMEKARELDKRDRYINTKAAKYQIRNDQNEKAIETMSFFTRNEAAGGPLGDLHDMQCLWYLTEDAESFLRQERLGLALKRFTAVSNIFNVWEEDQFDFHTFSLRKGMIRAYVELVKWEDFLRQHPFYTRAALGAVHSLLKLYDEPELASGSRAIADGLTNGVAKLSVTDQKRAAKKARTDQRKQERAELKVREEKRVKKSNAADDGEVRKEDTDPTGKQLLETKTPLEDALKFLLPVLDLSPDCIPAQHAGFDIYLRLRKPLSGLQCLVHARKAGPNNAETHVRLCRFLKWWSSIAQTSPARIQRIVERSLDLENEGELSIPVRNRRFLEEHDPPNAESIHSFLSVKLDVLEEKLEQREQKQMQDAIMFQQTSREVVEEGLRLLSQWKAGREIIHAYRETAHKRWPRAQAFKSVDE